MRIKKITASTADYIQISRKLLLVLDETPSDTVLLALMPILIQALMYLKPQKRKEYYTDIEKCIEFIRDAE